MMDPYLGIVIIQTLLSIMLQSRDGNSFLRILKSQMIWVMCRWTCSKIILVAPLMNKMRCSWVYDTTIHMVIYEMCDNPSGRPSY